MLAVNLSGPMLCCRKALKHLADGASIVFISSDRRPSFRLAARGL